MIDLKILRAEPERIRSSIHRRGVDVDLDRIIELDESHRKVLGEVENLRAEQNRISKKVAVAEKGDKQPAIEEAKRLSERLRALEESLQSLKSSLDDSLSLVPNLVHPDAPDGVTEEENVVVREAGERSSFDFAPKDHLEIGEALDVIEVARAAKVSGTRFGMLKGGGAILQLGLMRFAIDRVTSNGYRPVIPPVLVREEALFGMGFFPSSREEAYEIERDGLFLAGTSEAPLAGMHSDEIVPADELPIRYSAFSSCFRREAGTYGKDTRGIIRLHQFEKVEMFVLCSGETSDEEQQRILAIEEGIFRDLGIPYRVVDVCAGELGAPYARKFDLEAYLPGSDRWLEMTSCSNAYDYQARRLSIRAKREGSTELVHTLNGTAVTNRAIVAIFENHQRADGAVSVPEVLRPYTGLETISG